MPGAVVTKVGHRDWVACLSDSIRTVRWLSKLKLLRKQGSASATCCCWGKGSEPFSSDFKMLLGKLKNSLYFLNKFPPSCSEQPIPYWGHHSESPQKIKSAPAWGLAHRMRCYNFVRGTFQIILYMGMGMRGFFFLTSIAKNGPFKKKICDVTNTSCERKRV